MGITGIIIIAAIIVIIIILVLTNIRIVPQTNAYVIEVLGKYKTTWNAGLHCKAPFISRIANKVSLKEQVLDTPPQPVITKDNVTMQIDAVVYFHIFDPKLYTYGAAQPVLALANLSATTLRNIIGSMSLDEALVSRDTINAQLTALLDKATDPWGIKVTRVELKNIMPPADIKEAMEKQLRAERSRRESVLLASGVRESLETEALGRKQAKILEAEAEKEAQIAIAQARATAIKLVYEAEALGLERLSQVNISDEVLKLKGLEALKDVADGRATKIYMPSDIASIVSNLGVAGEALGIGDATAIDKTERPQPSIEDDPCISHESSEGSKDAYMTTEKIKNDVEKRRFKL